MQKIDKRVAPQVFDNGSRGFLAYLNALNQLILRIQ